MAGLISSGQGVNGPEHHRYAAVLKAVELILLRKLQIRANVVYPIVAEALPGTVLLAGHVSIHAPVKVRLVDGQQIVDNTMKRIMQDRENNVASVVLNYDKLKQLLDVDFERDVKQEPEYIPETNFKF